MGVNMEYVEGKLYVVYKGIVDMKYLVVEKPVIRYRYRYKNNKDTC